MSLEDDGVLPLSRPSESLLGASSCLLDAGGSGLRVVEAAGRELAANGAWTGSVPIAVSQGHHVKANDVKRTLHWASSAPGLSRETVETGVEIEKRQWVRSERDWVMKKLGMVGL